MLIYFRDDTLEVAADGQIADDVEGYAVTEVYSVEAFSLVAGSTYAVTALRGWLGTRRRSFPADAEVWLVPGFGVTGYFHEDFEVLKLNGITGYVRLAPYTLLSARELATCPDVAYRFAPYFEEAPEWVLDDPVGAAVEYASPPGEVAVRGRVRAQGPILHSFLISIAGQVMASSLLGGATGYEFSTSVPITGEGVHVVELAVLTISGRRFGTEVSFTVLPAPAQVATPLISPADQPIPANSALEVWVTCATPGAIIEVALRSFNNSGGPAPGEPGWDDAWWSPYSGGAILLYGLPDWYGFPTGKPTRVFARATAPGLAPSAVAERLYY